MPAPTNTTSDISAPLAHKFQETNHLQISPRETFLKILARQSRLNQRLHAGEPHRLPTVVRLPICHADRLPPIRRLIPKLIQKRRRLSRPPFDELTVITP